MDELTKLFINLVSIPSPSGHELEVGKYIKSYLDTDGIEANFDQSGKVNKSNSGNLIAKLPGDPKLPTLLFVAHMDTVETGDKPIKPIVKKEIIKSDGKTILGADDKGAVVALLTAISVIKTLEKHPTIFAIFSTREEQGKMGISLLELDEEIDFAFNLDGTGQPGTFINKALGETPFEIKIIGKATHAAIEPEKGKNTIKAAGLMISNLKLGKDKQGNIINIGKILGGKANNIVPDEVFMTGQVRAFTKTGLNEKLSEVRLTLAKACKETGCTFQFIAQPDEGAPPFSVDGNHEIVKLAEETSKTLNIPFNLKSGSFTCEANFLAQKYPVLNVCRGGRMAHSNEESITIKELHNLCNLIKELVKKVH